MIKKILFGLFGLIFILLLALIAIPLLYKDKLIQGIQEASSDTIHGEISFQDVDLTFFKSFPSLSLVIKEPQVSSENDILDKTLFKGKAIEMEVNVRSLFSEGPVVVDELKFDQPQLSILTDRSGRANYDIIKSTGKIDDGQKFILSLKEVSIEGADFFYLDQSSNNLISLENFNTVGAVTIDGEQYQIKHKGNISSSTMRIGTIPYLSEVQTLLEGNLIIDLSKDRYDFDASKIVLNDMNLDFNGWLELLEEEMTMDFNFKTADNEFRSLLSLIPAIYKQDFAKATIRGTMDCQGFLRGTYNDKKNQMPSFGIELLADDGYFKIPSMPQGLSSINIRSSISNNGNDVDQMVVDIPRFSFTMDDNPFSGNFNLQNPMSNPKIDTRVKGTIDLSSLRDIIPAPGFEQMSGRVDTDFEIKAKKSDIDNEEYSNTIAKGWMIVEDLKMQTPQNLLLHIQKMDLDISPSRLEIKEAVGNVGSSDFDIKGQIDNVVSLLTPDQPLSGELEFHSNSINANEWITDSDLDLPPETLEEKVILPLNDQSKFSIKANIDQIKYADYNISDANFSGRFRRGDFKIDGMGVEINGSELIAKGNIMDPLAYISEGAPLKGKLLLTSDDLDVSALMMDKGGTSEGTASDTSEVFSLPANWELTIDTDIRKLTYEDIEIKRLKGTLHVKDQIADFSELSGQTMGGTMGLDGTYNTQNRNEPLFDITYSLDEFDFKETFKNVPAFKSFVPIAEFIVGEFNSDFKVSGILGQDYFPKLNSINANGFLQALNGKLKDFKPLVLISQYLNLDDLKNLKLNNKKNHFKVENGTLTLAEVDYEIKDVFFKISGSHTLEQDINYLIKSKIPKEMITKNEAIAAVDKGIGTITEALNKYGVKTEQGDFVNVNFYLTGTIFDPKVDFKIVGIDGEKPLDEVAKETIDNTIDKAKDSITSLAEQKKEEAIDSVTQIINDKVDTLSTKVDSMVTEQIDSLINNPMVDSLLNSQLDGILGKDQKDSLKSKIGDILKNPFGKKKKDG